MDQPDPMPLSCADCAAKMPETAAFCPGCGRPMTSAVKKASGRVGALPERIAGALAYLTFVPAILFLVIEPYKKNHFVRFHSIQCLLLVVVPMTLATNSSLVPTYVAVTRQPVCCSNGLVNSYWRASHVSRLSSPARPAAVSDSPAKTAKKAQRREIPIQEHRGLVSSIAGDFRRRILLSSVCEPSVPRCCLSILPIYCADCKVPRQEQRGAQSEHGHPGMHHRRRFERHGRVQNLRRTLLPFPHRFEKGDRVGGNWVFNNKNGMSSAYRLLHINTSRDKMVFADFPSAGRLSGLPAPYAHRPVFRGLRRSFRLSRARCRI